VQANASPTAAVAVAEAEAVAAAAATEAEAAAAAAEAEAAAARAEAAAKAAAMTAVAAAAAKAAIKAVAAAAPAKASAPRDAMQKAEAMSIAEKVAGTAAEGTRLTDTLEAKVGAAGGMVGAMGAVAGAEQPHEGYMQLLHPLNSSDESGCYSCEVVSDNFDMGLGPLPSSSVVVACSASSTGVPRVLDQHAAVKGPALETPAAVAPAAVASAAVAPAAGLRLELTSRSLEAAASLKFERAAGYEEVVTVGPNWTASGGPSCAAAVACATAGVDRWCVYCG
jgi:hypothetical protein